GTHISQHVRHNLIQELPEQQWNDMQLHALGRLDALPTQVRRELESAIDATSANRGLLVNLAINYGGRAEIVDAVNTILDMARLSGSIETLRIDEDQIVTSLYTEERPDPALLIRYFVDMMMFIYLLCLIVNT